MTYRVARSRAASLAKPAALSLLLLAAASLLPALPARAIVNLSLSGFSQTLLTNGVSNGTAMEIAPDGRVFVLQQDGSVRVIKNGSLLATPFATVPTTQNGERGLLGIAFDPNYATNRKVYLYYTATENGNNFNKVVSVVAVPNNPDVALSGETEIIRLNNLSGATNHNGGAIHFGTDGKLYIGVGENANPANSQTLNNLLGKVLRINTDGSIPTDNPFFNTATGVNRAIWAMGVRNPYTFAVQPGTGAIYINDVGQNTWEEINVGLAGANYGWGSNQASNSGPNEGPFNQADFPQYTPPLFAYTHGGANTQGFAIVGGAFYNPQVTRTFDSSFVGDYFYADLINGWIRYLDAGTANTNLFATGGNNLVDLKVGNDGGLYYLERGTNSVYRIQGQLGVSVAPEPGVLSLLALGLTVTALARKRRK